MQKAGNESAAKWWLQMFKYEEIARHFNIAIETGTLPAGAKLPSLRALCRQFDCSMSVALQAYQELEIRERIRAAEKSGYFVLPKKTPAPKTDNKGKKIRVLKKIKANNAIARIVEIGLDSHILPFSSGMPDPSILPMAELKKSILRTARDSPHLLSKYTPAKGSLDLRRELAQLMLTKGINVGVDDILITNGCIEALSVAIRATTQAGDIVAIETPTFFGLITMLEQLDRKVIEIPTHVHSGMDLDFFEQSVNLHSIKACVVSSSSQNPLGFCMSEVNKKKIADIAKKYGVTLIEDDVYGECNYDPDGRMPIGHYGKNVIYCSSFSKSTSAGIRIGWMIPGKWQGQCENLKITETLGGSALLQSALANFLSTGSYDFHIRRFRKKIIFQTHQIKQFVQTYFPPQTRISTPQGGFFLWVELPQKIDSMILFEKALQSGIGIVPGSVFSTNNKFKHFVRLSCGSPIGPQTQSGIQRLGQIVWELMSQ